MNRQARILIVDDELPILRAVTPLLKSRGYEVQSVVNGKNALTEVGSDPPDLLILDLGLPDIDGLELVRRVRERSAVPILVLSARGSEKDKVSALDLGADDYVTKPFGPDEFLARVRACLRRAQGPDGENEAGTIVRSDLTIDFERHRVTRGDEEIRLTPKEFELLVFLARHPGKVLTHRAILKAVWGPHAVSEPQYLRVLMASLRKKIEPDPGRPKYVMTEPWVGYRFRES
ncbi:MAG TPA: response regulator transcription factor [Vicinamibacteria bacterium]|nr:response regulator transcription factor [Vicinamibacteria bacterium]